MVNSMPYTGYVEHFRTFQTRDFSAENRHLFLCFFRVSPWHDMCRGWRKWWSQSPPEVISFDPQMVAETSQTPVVNSIFLRPNWGWPLTLPWLPWSGKLFRPENVGANITCPQPHLQSLELRRAQGAPRLQPKICRKGQQSLWGFSIIIFFNHV